MMICKADFEELFPGTFAAERKDTAAPATVSGDGYADPARLGLAMAALPALSAENATRALLSTFGYRTQEAAGVTRR